MRLTIEKFGGYKTEVKGRTETMERLALRNKVKEEERLLIEIYGGLREDIGMKKYINSPAQWIA